MMNIETHTGPRLGALSPTPRDIFGQKKHKACFESEVA